MHALGHGRYGALLILITFVVAARAVGQAAFDSSRADSVAIDRYGALGSTQYYDTTEGAVGEYPVAISGKRAYWARIEPESTTYRTDTMTLARGRIVARIISDSDYAPLGFGKGVNWWWIDRRGGEWRSVIVSESLRSRKVTFVGKLATHGSYRWKQSFARLGPTEYLRPTPSVIRCWIPTGQGGCMYC